MDSPGIHIHHFPAGTLARKEKVVSKDWIWDRPREWEILPRQTLRLATYMIPSAMGSLELAVSELPSDAGGLLPNINRWRNQMALKPLVDLKSSRAVLDLPASRHGALLVQIPSPDEVSPDSRAMLVGWLETSRATTFFKLSGTTPAVASVREGFLSFMASIKLRTPEGSIR